MEGRLRGDEGRDLAEQLIRTYYRTQDYPFTRHHIESYDQFVSQDLPAILRSENPLTLLEEPIGSTGVYALKAEIFLGGPEGDRITIGTPTISLQNSEEVRVLYPNEARLRNLTYAAQVSVDLVIRVTISKPNPSGGRPTSETILMDSRASPEKYGYLANFPLLRLPIMLHSRFCVLHGKPQAFLKEVGECPFEQGGYFIVEGSEKILVTRQEQAFNVLYVTKQEADPKMEIYATISCLNPATRQVKRVAFGLRRRANTLVVNLPMVRAPIPVFVLFRAMGLQTDRDIVRAIFPDPDSAEAQQLEPLLHESILEAHPFLDTYSAVQFIKTMTKGFSEAHVLDILHNKTFIHVEDRPGARIAFLAECVRRILRVAAGIDPQTNRDDIRNQRCLTSGVLTRQLVQGAFAKWRKAMMLTLDKEFNFNKSIYRDLNFLNMFQQGTLSTLFKAGMMTESVMRGFKGKWGDTLGEENAGVLQALSRLSFMDFLSHCRRAVLDFDTGMKLPGPRRLNTSQYGYFCTNETPTGASIGITKNLTMLSAISTATDPAPFIDWLFKRGGVLPCSEMTAAMHAVAVPVFVNAGIVGYTLRPQALVQVLKVMKWTGCLPAAASIGFSIRERRVGIFLDEGRPLRPLIHLDAGGAVPLAKLRALGDTWRNLVMGNLPYTKSRGLHQTGFVDPLASTEAPSLEEYMKALAPYAGVIEYVDPYESNEAYVAMYPEHIQAESSHLEIHPSTMLGLMTSVIPFPNHNQSPRNQLSCSQSKQGLSVYATNYPNRFDNQVHVLCYGESPLVRSVYYDYVADGQMPYGQNIVVAIASFTGYNQDDGILFNADSFQRGMFRSTCYRSYEAAEEDDDLAKTRTRIGNPARIPGWTSLKAGVDYSHLDERGIIRVGTLVDENTVLVGRYMQGMSGDMRDASVTAQVWTTGRVEKVAVMTDNQGRALVKVRVVQERVPELGDKFSTRHGQKGTMGMLLRAHDMPRTASGLVPDMVVNPHCMPSRMTMAQLLESLLGKAAAGVGAIGNATAFMNDGDPSEEIGKVLAGQLGLNPMGDDLLYDGMSGQMVPSTIFMGPIYIMRLKHMTEDKWNARGEGRREQRTHQPTGGRGAQGGLRIGEMERDAILGHGVIDFTRETYMKRADAYQTWVCNGCGLIPIYNERTSLFVCPTCDGPVRFIGDSAATLKLLPPNKRSLVTFSKVEIPYATKLLDQEVSFFLNMSTRMLTDRAMKRLRGAPIVELTADQQAAALAAVLPERVVPETAVPEMIAPKEEEEARPEDLAAMGAVAPELPEGPVEQVNRKALNAAMTAAVNAVIEKANSGTATAATLNATAVNAAVTAAMAAAREVGPETEGAAALSGVAANALPQNLVFTPAQPAAVANGALSGATSGAANGLEEADLDALPEGEPVLAGNAAGQAGLTARATAPPAAPLVQTAGGGAAPVNVQTATQPVLVVPLNVGTAPPPAEYIAPPAPGAPPTFAVDTGPGAMSAAGLQSGGYSRPASPSRSRGGSPRGGGGGGNRSRGGSMDALSAPNVKVNVVKTG
jgi:DNA-directed RNA polymerase II subunit RPB2